MSEKNESRGFDDNFVEDETITPNYLQRKIAPQTCAISKQELVKLYKALYDRKIKKKKLTKRSVIINDEWVRIQTDSQTNEGKIIIQAIIY